MAVPAFWNTPFSYTEIASGVDVGNIIAAVNTALVALSWTDESGVGTGPWRTPSRADGVFFRVSMTRVSATRWTWLMYDQSGVSITGAGNYQQDIEATGCTVIIFAGSMHLAVYCARPTPESCWMCVLDQTPEPINFPRAMYVIYTGPRTVDGTLRNYGWQFHRELSPTGTAYQDSQRAIQRANGGQYHRRTMSLTNLFSPAEFGDSGATPSMFYGRAPQAILVDDALFLPGSEITVPIDAGTNAVFKVLGGASFAQQRIAFRKS